MSQNRAIYPSRYFHYIALLCVAKLCRSFGIFFSYDILKLVHVVQFLFCVKAGAAVFLVFLQKPFTNGKRISKNQWFRITRHAFFGTTIHLLWLFGLTLCGPLRTLLLFEHSDMVIIAGASALFTSASSPAKFRGAVFFLVAVMGILLFDHDDVQAHLNEKPPEHHRGSHNGIFAHLFDHMTDMTGLSDHKGGVVLLFGTLCMSVGFKSAARKLSVDVGGAKRLHALSTLISALLLLPWSTVLHFTQEMGLITSWTSFLVPLTLVILVVFVGDYYVEAACVSKLELTRTNCFGAIATFLSALLLSCFWNHPFVTQMTSMKHLKEIISEDHVLSGGVIFSLVLFIFATHILTSQTKSNRGNLIGFSAAGLPLYNFTGDKLSKTSNSLLLFAKNGLRQILEDSDSRKIFYFLCVNLSFTFVELIYGAWTNSLGLISDGFHMLFDCSALVMGLYAAVMSRWKATRIFSYGYDRIEVLSGFINGLFLAVIAFFVFTAALTRLVDPPEIHTERLLAVSAAGLVVNLFGIFAFRHAHSHGGGHGHSHGGGHGHSHGGGHGHSHNPGKGSSGAHSHVTHNTNMEGVFLHVLADTLGSVGVIISSILIENFGWKIADPVCSIFIAVLIFLSVVPLLKETAQILLLHFPQDAEEDITVALQKIVQIDGVTGYSRPHFWRHSSKSLCGTLHIQAQSSASEQKLIQQVTSLLKDAGITNLVVQVEKETYFTHMTGLGASVDSAFQTTQNLHTLTYQTNYSHL